MGNLDEVWHYDDPVDRWAADREYELRRERYEAWLAGGVAGAISRVTAAFWAMSAALAGDPERVRA